MIYTVCVHQPCTPLYLSFRLICTTTAVLNSYYSELYSYWANFHDAYVRMLRPHPLMILTTLPYKSHRTYLTNHMEFISQHITPLVIDSLGGGDSNRHRHPHRNNFKKSGVCWHHDL